MRCLLPLLIASLPLAAGDQGSPGQPPSGQPQAGHERPAPLTDAEKALMEQIRALHQQIEAKRKALLALLEKDHPKLAEMMQHRIGQEGQGPGQRRGPGQGQEPGQHREPGQGQGAGQGQGPGQRRGPGQAPGQGQGQGLS